MSRDRMGWAQGLGVEGSLTLATGETSDLWDSECKWHGASLSPHWCEPHLGSQGWWWWKSQGSSLSSGCPGSGAGFPSTAPTSPVPVRLVALHTGWYACAMSRKWAAARAPHHLAGRPRVGPGGRAGPPVPFRVVLT